MSVLIHGDQDHFGFGYLNPLAFSGPPTLGLHAHGDGDAGLNLGDVAGRDAERLERRRGGGGGG
jgi:hypothetical protein